MQEGHDLLAICSQCLLDGTELIRGTAKTQGPDGKIAFDIALGKAFDGDAAIGHAKVLDALSYLKTCKCNTASQQQGREHANSCFSHE